MPRWWGGLAAAAVAAALTGCAGRTLPPQVGNPAPPGGFHLMRYPEAGVQLTTPRNWMSAGGHPPLVALITSGPAVISLWRYPQSRPGPQTAAALRRAEHRLIAAARSRDRSLRVLDAALTTVDGEPAVEVETVQRIGASTRRVQSTHVYRPGEEVVLEEYAPLSLFDFLERSVFSVVRRSLTALGR